jgi:hypothetical protein
MGRGWKVHLPRKYVKQFVNINCIELEVSLCPDLDDMRSDHCFFTDEKRKHFVSVRFVGCEAVGSTRSFKRPH